MALSDLKFLFENSNGAMYKVTINVDTGDGYAYRVDDDDTPITDLTKVTVTVDSGSVAALPGYHPSRLCHAAIFNTSNALNSVLDGS